MLHYWYEVIPFFIMKVEFVIFPRNEMLDFVRCFVLLILIGQ